MAKERLSNEIIAQAIPNLEKAHQGKIERNYNRMSFFNEVPKAKMRINNEN